MRGALTGMALALGLLCLTPAAAAQQKPPPKKTTGTGEFAFVNTTGNASSTSIGLRGEVTHRPDGWFLRWRAGFVRLESDDALKAQSFALLSRAERQYSPRLSYYGQHDYLRDLFAGIAHKHVASGGLSHKLFETARHNLTIDGAFGATNEQRTAGDDVTAVVALGGAAYALKISETTDLTEDVRYEQSLARGEDWRADNTLALVTRINSIFSLKVSNVLRYVHAPVDGFQTTDTITSVALVAKF